MSVQELHTFAEDNKSSEFASRIDMHAEVDPECQCPPKIDELVGNRSGTDLASCFFFLNVILILRLKKVPQTQLQDADPSNFHE